MMNFLTWLILICNRLDVSTHSSYSLTDIVKCSQIHLSVLDLVLYLIVLDQRFILFKLCISS